MQVRRPNVTVTYRQGYLAEAPAVQPLEWGEEEWRIAIANPLSSSVVGLDGLIHPGADVRACSISACKSRSMICTFAMLARRSAAEIEIATAEAVARGDFAFRVERASCTASTQNQER